jgi:two-component system NtrC family sensor kinase
VGNLARPVLRLSEPAIPWRHRLTTKLLAATLSIMAVGVLAFAATENRFRDSLVGQMTSGSELFSHTIERATTKAMLENRKEEAYETMRAIGAQPGIERVRMFDQRGRIRFSTDEAEIGRTVEKTAEPCAACHGGPRPRELLAADERIRISQAPDHRVMGLLRPIYNETRCSNAACHQHAPEQRVLGLLDVGVSLEDVDLRISAFRQWNLFLTVAGVLVMGGTLLLLARRHVVRPVFALVEGTRRVARDELDVQIRVHSEGELGVLAQAFNEMTRSLRRAEADLRELNHSLEQKVEERTAELKRAQAKLIQSEKLWSLGQLSASIAHEINNPLAGILTFTRLLQREAERDVPDGERRREIVRNLRLVQRETERCSAIVRNLLDFARERPMELKDVDLNAVVNESLQLVGHQIAMLGESVEKRLDALPPVHGDFGQLRQAVVNVALNACEAMTRGGKLTIATRAPDGGVELAISDTGPGIASEHLPRIFDPFFTTKEKGTGLGLSVVYGIVQRHQGTIEVKSDPGKGATFTIRLPAARR